MAVRNEGGHINELVKQLCQHHLTSFSSNSPEVAKAFQHVARMLENKPFKGDEEQIHGIVKSRVMSTKGYNSANVFSDCYEKLLQHDDREGPNTRGPMLHFLHQLSVASDTSVALVKSKNRADYSNRTQDFSRLSQQDYSGSSRDFRSPEMPVAVPRMLSTRDQTMATNKDNLVVPRYASAVICADNFDGYSEADLIRDLLFVFQGIETAAIRWDPNKQQFIPLPALQLSDPMLDLACKLAELGYLYRQIKTFMEQRVSEQSYGLIGQAFCSALVNELTDFYKLIAILEAQNASGRLSLHRLIVWTFDPLDRLRLLASMVQQAGFNYGGSLATSLHTFLQHGDPTYHSVVKEVLHLTTRPLREMLRRWIYEGECCDAYGEFFITVDADVPEDALWESKYSIRANMLPSFIPLDIAKRILLIGKTINFVRVVCRDHRPISFPFSTVASSKEALNNVIGPELQAHINEVYKITSSHLISLLKTNFFLCEHLTALRDYLLLGQGDFIQHLMDLICKDLSLNAAELRTPHLQSKLETAQRATNAQFHHPEVIRKLNVIKLDASSQDKGWDVFSLDYDVTGPLAVIVPKDDRECYLCIFRMLWKTKRIEHGLTKVWTKTVMWSRTLQQLTQDINQYQYLVNISTAEMQHFISQVQYYINFEVLEGSWKEFEEAVDSAEDLDTIISAHRVFLSKVNERMMLSESHKDVLEALYSVYTTIVTFMEEFGTAGELFKTNNALRENRVTKANSNTKQGKWGSSAERDAEAEREDNTFLTLLANCTSDTRKAHSEFEKALTKFLLLLNKQSDDSMKFLSLRLDFNEYYKAHNVALAVSPFIARSRSVYVT